LSFLSLNFSKILFFYCFKLKKWYFIKKNILIYLRIFSARQQQNEFYDKFLGDRGKEKEKELQGISFCNHFIEIHHLRLIKVLQRLASPN
jgi:hypothetical protein